MVLNKKFRFLRKKQKILLKIALQLPFRGELFGRFFFIKKENKKNFKNFYEKKGFSKVLSNI